MRLATFLPPGATTARAGEVRDDHVAALPDGVDVLSQLRRGGAASVTGEEWALGDVTLLAPIAQPPAIFGIGLNYADHARETGAQPPEAPIVFGKLPGSAAGPFETVRCPAVVRRLDYEGELAVVLDDGGGVLGYAVADDVSSRDLQRREPHWVRAKGADGFCPYGPWITTPDEVGDVGDLALRTWVNGELRQESSTAQMIFDVPALIDFIAQVHRPLAGELILTGTPSGVGMGMDPPRFLAGGDVVRIEIERLGAIEHAIASA